MRNCPWLTYMQEPTDRQGTRGHTDNVSTNHTTHKHTSVGRLSLYTFQFNGWHMGKLGLGCWRLLMSKRDGCSCREGVDEDEGGNKLEAKERGACHQGMSVLTSFVVIMWLLEEDYVALRRYLALVRGGVWWGLGKIRFSKFSRARKRGIVGKEKLERAFADFDIFCARWS